MGKLVGCNGTVEQSDRRRGRSGHLDTVLRGTGEYLVIAKDLIPVVQKARIRGIVLIHTILPSQVDRGLGHTERMDISALPIAHANFQQAANLFQSCTLLIGHDVPSN